MFPIVPGLTQTLPVLLFSGSSAQQKLFSRAQGTVGFTRKRRKKRHPPTGTLKDPWGPAWPQWQPRTPHHGSSEVTSCALLLQGDPAQVPGQGDPAQVPAQRSSCPKQVQFADPSCCLWRFQRPPCRLCHRAVSWKNRWKTQAGEHLCTSQGTSRDRDTLVASPNPSSSSISSTISCQKPKRQSSITSQMANMFPKEYSKCSLPVNQQGSYSTSPLAL